MTGEAAFSSLAEKIRSLDLDADEATALAVILRRACDAGGPEVEGFGFEIGTLGFDTDAGRRGFKGSDEELQAFSGRGFKGTDEELQALLDWTTSRG